jgi:hypothetical protein
VQTILLLGDPLIKPAFRHSREGGNPVTAAYRVGLQRHWIPDIASRFRDDEQNQCFPNLWIRKGNVRNAVLLAWFGDAPPVLMDGLQRGEITIELY